ncbi:hypothetical protein [Streptomyces sp. NPDC050164]|uniref:hypothetical protein n=1 Tax=Streptomyces sp. NPDC050164 TaxID=3365605 RepID=UPI0037891ED5
MSAVDWGDVPTWAAAVFAGGAALFAYQTIRSQREQIGEQRQFIAEQSANLRLERAELQAQADERRRSQANLVSIQAAQVAVGTRPDVDHRWLVRVRNLSDEPIHQVMATFGEHLQVATATAHQLPEGARVVPVLGAEDSAEFRSHLADGENLNDHRPAILFTDNAGVRWCRDTLGNLNEIDQP